MIHDVRKQEGQFTIHHIKCHVISLGAVAVLILSDTFEMFQFFDIILVSEFVLYGFTGFLFEIERSRVYNVTIE
jgi:hypothetical protein